MTDQPAGPTYALYASFAADPGRPLPEQERALAAAQAQAALESTAASLRGAYTLTGYRADADILLWLVGHSADAVQDALIAFRRTTLGYALRPVWSAIGVHREAEFATSHTPAFMRGEPPCWRSCGGRSWR
jgi:chlorite dismutase